MAPNTIQTTPLPVTVLAGFHQKTILDGIEKLLLSKEYSDLTIICGDKIFPAHKIIVCPKSAYFAAACGGHFKESSGEIRLDDKEPFLVEKVLEFLYTGIYTQKPRAIESQDSEIDASDQPPTKRLKTASHEASEGSPTSCKAAAVTDLTRCNAAYFHMRLYGEADYFMIDGLKAMAKEYFRILMSRTTKTPLSELVNMAKEAYSTRANYQEIKEPLIAALSRPTRTWIYKQPLVTDLLRSHPDLSVDLCQELVSRYAPPSSSNWPNPSNPASASKKA